MSVYFQYVSRQAVHWDDLVVVAVLDLVGNVVSLTAIALWKIDSLHMYSYVIGAGVGGTIPTEIGLLTRLKSL